MWICQFGQVVVCFFSDKKISSETCGIQTIFLFMLFLDVSRKKTLMFLLRLRGWSGEASILYIKLSSVYKTVFYTIHYLLISVNHSSVLLKIFHKVVENGLIWVAGDCCVLLVFRPAQHFIALSENGVEEPYLAIFLFLFYPLPGLTVPLAASCPGLLPGNLYVPY